MTQRGKTIEQGESSNHELSEDQTNAQALSAGQWDDMEPLAPTATGATAASFIDTGAGMNKLFGSKRTEQPPAAIDPAMPDGRVVIDPYQLLERRRTMKDAMSDPNFAMDESGQFHWVPKPGEPGSMGSGAGGGGTSTSMMMSIEEATRDSAASAKRPDGTLSEVSSIEGATGIQQKFSLNDKGQVESLTITDDLDNEKVIRFNERGEAEDGKGRVTVERDSDGTIRDITYNDGKVEQTYELDGNGQVKYLTSIEGTADSGRVEISTRFKDGKASMTTTARFNAAGILASKETDDGFEHVVQNIDEKGNMKEEFSTSPDRARVVKYYDDHSERISLTSDGMYTEHNTYKDKTITYYQKNLATGDTTYKRTDSDGSSVETIDSKNANVVVQTDSFGFWIKKVTNKLNGDITETVGNSKGQMGEPRISRGA